MDQIARIETDPGDSKLRTEFARQFNHRPDCFERIVCVHQQSRFRKAAHKTAESFHLALTRLNVAMRHRAGYGDTVYAAGQNVGGSANTGDVKGPGFL